MEFATTLTGNGERDIEDFLIDDAGNVYATGYFHGLMCYGDSCIQSLAPDSADIFICKLDSSLNLIWFKRLGGTGIDWGLTLTKGENGEVILGVRFSGDLALSDTTITSNFPGIGYYNPTDFALLRLLENGQIYVAYHPGGDSFNILEHVESYGGKTIVSGRFASGTMEYDESNSHFDDGPITERFFIILDNTFEFEKSLPLVDLDNYPVGFSQIQLNTNNIYTLGAFEDTLFLSGEKLFIGRGRFNFIASIDFSGQIIWIKVFSQKSFSITRIALDDKRNLYIRGEVRDIIAWDHLPIELGGTLLKIAPNGSLIWKALVFKPGSFTSFVTLDILINSQGIYSAGFVSYPIVIQDSILNPFGNQGDGLIVKHNLSDGRIQWLKQLGSYGLENIKHLKSTTQGTHFLIGDFINNVTTLDSFVLFNPIPGLQIPFIARLSNEEIFDKFDLDIGNWGFYPNPSHDFICLRGKWEDSPLAIELFTIHGQKIYSEIKSPHSQDEQITLKVPENLSSGIYILSLSQQGTRRSFKVAIQ